MVIILFISVLVLCRFTSLLIVTQISYKDKGRLIHLQQLLTDSELKLATDCYTDDCHVHACYPIVQDVLIKKLKQKLNVDNIYTGHSRFSSGGKQSSNYDAANFHRDVKRNFVLFDKHVPEVWTIVIYLDDARHQQGGEKISVAAGDVLVFNSFNMHKTLPGNNSSNQRRVLQFFHVFFDKDEQTKFYENHTYAHYTGHPLLENILIKNISSMFDIRLETELIGLWSLLVPHKSQNKDTKYKTVTKEHNNGTLFHTSFV